MGIGRSHDRPKRSSPNLLLPLVFNSALKFGIMTNEEFIESIRLDGEIWKDVVGFEGLYMVSSFGRVMSLSREKKVRDGIFIITKPIILKQTIRHSNGIPYYRVHLTNALGKQFYKTIHRIVATAFIKNDNDFSDVDHISRDSLDNTVGNLRWCTRKMNMGNENTRKILQICHKGADRSYLFRPVAMIKDGVEIRRYKSISEASRDGFNGNNITQVCRGDKKTHRGYRWVYLDKF